MCQTAVVSDFGGSSVHEADWPDLDRLRSLTDMANFSWNIKKKCRPRGESIVSASQWGGAKTLGKASEELMPSEDSRTAN